MMQQYNWNPRDDNCITRMRCNSIRRLNEIRHSGGIRVGCGTGGAVEVAVGTL
jgi:hypothetical protein